MKEKSLHEKVIYGAIGLTVLFILLSELELKGKITEKGFYKIINSLSKDDKKLLKKILINEGK